MYILSDKVKFIETFFGPGDLSRDEKNFVVLCPFCREAEVRKGNRSYSKRKFVIRVADDVCHCWVCGWKSRSLAPLFRKLNASSELREYADRFATQRQIGWSSGEEESLQDKLALPSDSLLLATADRSDPYISKCLRYLEDTRNLSERDLWYFKVLCSPHILRDRVIFPSFDSYGQLNYYVARSIDSRGFPRYVMPDREIVGKTDIVFGEANIDWKRELVLVEGMFDYAKAPDNSTPLLGNDLSETSELFTRIVLHDTPCVVMLDDDAKSRASAVAKKLDQYGIPVRIAKTGKFHDPGEMTRREVQEAIDKAVRWTRDFALRDRIFSISV